MSTPASIQELRLAIGFKKQSALQTALVAADCWSLNTTSPAIPQPILNVESNEDDFGKGDSWATQQFPSHIDSNFPWEYYLTSENAAMLFAFALGKAAKTTAGTGFKYTCTPLDASADGIDMPATTVVAAIRQGASDVFDLGLIGMCLEDFSISLKSGPGRANSTMRSNWVGCGKYVKPSAIAIPAIATEHALNSGGSAITILAQDYVTTKKFISLDFSWKNNIRLQSGNFPGSGTQSGFQIRGRMRRGKPQCSLQWVVEFMDGSTELDDFLAMTEGTAVIDVTGAEISTGFNHKLLLTLQRLQISSAPIRETDGIVSVACQATTMKHATNGVISAEVTTTQDSILTAAA